MKQIDKNTVNAENQVKSLIFKFNELGKGIRVLFLGNSITNHEECLDIGWEHDFGMAASARDNDYVHILMKRFQEKDKDAIFMIAHVADWERNYKNGSDLFTKYKEAREFNADIIIMRAIENCPNDDFDKTVFKKQYMNLINYFNSNGNAKIILTTSFWQHNGDDTIQEIGDELGYSVIYLGDLGEDDDMKAIGLFDHTGVANHPGDKGMLEIAERIWKYLNKII